MFKCECGKEFDNAQSFNGHKSNCQVHQEACGKIFYQSIKDPAVRKKMAETRQKTIQLKKLEQLTKWIAEAHVCECCGKVMTEKFGSGRFCSRTCANTKHHSEETKKKISQSTYHRPKAYCTSCGKELSPNNKIGLCKECYLNDYPEWAKQKQSKAMQGKPRWNIHRNQRSFAEKFWENVLNNNNIIFKTEVPVKYDEIHCYFLDFEIEKNGKLIDLEIDGKQHLERAADDAKRDAFISNTHLVYRVAWNDLRYTKGKLEMQNKINKFLEFYDKL